MLAELAAGEVTLATVWLLGVSMGLTACTVTCLPFMGTWALGRASHTREAFIHTGVFLLGRITAYTLLGLLAAATGQGVMRALGGALGHLMIGLASLFAGLWLIVQPSGKPCRAVPQAPSLQPIRSVRQPRDPLPPLFFGAALSLSPCTPLASLLALSAQAGHAAQGAAYGLAFGLGAAMTPLLVLVPLAGRLGRELRAGRLWLARALAFGAAVVLIALGVRRLWLAF